MAPRPNSDTIWYRPTCCTCSDFIFNSNVASGTILVEDTFMSMAQSLLPEFDNEMANTRKMLERIPDNKLDYKPDPKSMSMGVLASHIAEMVGWLKETIEKPSIDIEPGFKPFLATSRKEL